jgi:hypothetical protein
MLPSQFPHGRDVEPGVAGPVTWTAERLHIDSLPDEPDEATQQAVVNRMAGLGLVFPCTLCRYHFTQRWDSDPLTLPVTRVKASRWLWESYNTVQRLLKKPETPYTEWILTYKRWCTYKRASVFFETHDAQVRELNTTRPSSLTYVNNLDQGLDVFYDTIKRPNHMASYIFTTAVTVVIAILLLIVAVRVLFAKKKRIRDRDPLEKEATLRKTRMDPLSL